MAANPNLPTEERAVTNAQLYEWLGGESAQPDLSQGLFHSVYHVDLQRVGEGNGFVQNVQIRPGLTLSMRDFSFYQTLRHDVEFDQPLVSFVSWVTGTARYHIPFLGQRGEFLPNVAHVFKAPPHEGQAWYLAGERYRTLSINFTPDAFQQLAGEDSSLWPTDLWHTLHQPEAFFMGGGALNAALRKLTLQILDNRQTGLLRQFFLESKLLELMALYAEYLQKQQRQQTPEGSTQPNYTKAAAQLEAVRDLLDVQFAHPPSLLEIARQVGLNLMYLKDGFRKRYGLSVYQYVQNRRLERAHSLLTEERLPVAEVALAVGYESLASFSNAFFKQYGIRPSALLRG